MELKSEPTNPSERIGSLDFLRGIAILGILVINIETFSYPDPWSSFKYGFNDARDELTRFWVYFFTQGKSFSMLALLFGAGFYIFLERLEQKSNTKAFDIYARRLFWLFIFGVVHAYLIWDGDILYHYATCGFLLFPFRTFSIKKLFSVLLILISVLLINAYVQAANSKKEYLQFVETSKITPEMRTVDDKKIIEGWEKRTTKQRADTSHIETPRKTYLESIFTNTKHAEVHKGKIIYSGILFRTLIMMLLGIILYKSGIFLDYRSLKFYWPLTITITLIAIIINYYRYYHWTFNYFEPVTSFWKEWLFTFPKETLGLAYILILNGIYQLFFKRISTKLISNIGRSALTNYILQSILCGFIFYGYGLGMYNQFSRFELLGIVALIWFVQLILSWFWLKKFEQGPLELLWKRLTYGQFK